MPFKVFIIFIFFFLLSCNENREDNRKKYFEKAHRNIEQFELENLNVENYKSYAFTAPLEIDKAFFLTFRYKKLRNDSAEAPSTHSGEDFERKKQEILHLAYYLDTSKYHILAHTYFEYVYNDKNEISDSLESQKVYFVNKKTLEIENYGVPQDYGIHIK